LHESQVAYLKLQAHTASLQSLKECYCRYAHMLDGARTMFNAYQQTTTKRDSIDQVKLGLKECTQVSFFFVLFVGSEDCFNKIERVISSIVE
jgi:hypothetical protein